MKGGASSAQRWFIQSAGQTTAAITRTTATLRDGVISSRVKPITDNGYTFITFCVSTGTGLRPLMNRTSRQTTVGRIRDERRHKLRGQEKRR